MYFIIFIIFSSYTVVITLFCKLVFFLLLLVINLFSFNSFLFNSFWAIVIIFLITNILILVYCIYIFWFSYFYINPSINITPAISPDFPKKLYFPPYDNFFKVFSLSFYDFKYVIVNYINCIMEFSFPSSRHALRSFNLPNRYKSQDGKETLAKVECILKPEVQYHLLSATGAHKTRSKSMSEFFQYYLSCLGYCLWLEIKLVVKGFNVPRDAFIVWFIEYSTCLLLDAQKKGGFMFNSFKLPFGISFWTSHFNLDGSVKQEYLDFCKRFEGVKVRFSSCSLKVSYGKKRQKHSYTKTSNIKVTALINKFEITSIRDLKAFCKFLDTHSSLFTHPNFAGSEKDYKKFLDNNVKSSHF